MDQNAPITSKHVLPKRSAKMIDTTEKPKIPFKFAKRAMNLAIMKFKCNQMMHSYKFYSFLKDQSLENE